MMQMTLDDTRPLSPQAQRILEVLKDGKIHSGLEFVNGTHGFTVLAYSQRCGDLRKAGHHIVSFRHGGHVASYRLEG